MITLVGNSGDFNIAGLREYASEADIDFARKRIRAIGHTGIRIKSYAVRRAGVLMYLINTRVSYAAQEAFVIVKVGYSEVKSIATVAANYIRTRGTSDSLFRAYFGATTSSKPLTVFAAVANANSSSRTLSCTDPYSVRGNSVIAYPVTSTASISCVYCSIFYNDVSTPRLCSGTTVASRNIRGGTMLHEITHVLSVTTNVGYGCSYD